jgi:hypothetical protein
MAEIGKSTLGERVSEERSGGHRANSMKHKSTSAGSRKEPSLSAPGFMLSKPLALCSSRGLPSGFIPPDQPPLLIEGDITTVDVRVIPDGFHATDDLAGLAEQVFDLSLLHSHGEPPPVLLILPSGLIGCSQLARIFTLLEEGLQLLYTEFKFADSGFQSGHLLLLGKKGRFLPDQEGHSKGKREKKRRNRGSFHFSGHTPCG